MSKARSQSFVNAWLEQIRVRELSIKKSVELWEQRWGGGFHRPHVVVRPRGPGFKQSLYFDVPILEEIRSEAVRQGRPISWMLRKAWRLASGKFPKPLHTESR